MVRQRTNPLDQMLGERIRNLSGSFHAPAKPGVATTANASAHAIIEFRITWASNCEVTPFLSEPRGATRSRPDGYEANDDVRLSPFRSASVHSNV
jgi:hypothetical protein